MLQLKHGIILVAALAMSIQLAHAQKMPGRRACSEGMTFQQCLDRCEQLGGKPKKGKSGASGCSKMCSKKGCK
jgi:hypothetical protein